jgi:hypothetical protein
VISSWCQARRPFLEAAGALTFWYCGVVVEGSGEEDVGAIGADRQSTGGEVGGSSGGAKEGGRAVMGADVVEGVLWGW